MTGHPHPPTDAAEIDALYRRHRIGLHYPVSTPEALNRLVADTLAAFGPEALQEVYATAIRANAAGEHPEVPKRYLADYVDRQLGGFVAQVNVDNGSPRVVFVVTVLNYKALREALALRRRGFRTFLICMNWFPDPVRAGLDGAFEQVLIIQNNRLLLETLLERLRPELFHAHLDMFQYATGRTVIDCKGDALAVCELNDITSVYAEPKWLAALQPPDVVALDLAMEGYVCRNADALVHQFSPEVEDELRGRHGGLTRAIEFQPYPTDDFIAYSADKHSHHDGIIRSVFPGNAPPIAPTHPPQVMPARGLFDSALGFAMQGLGVDVMLDPSKPLDAGHESYAPWHQLSKRFPHFRLLNGVPPHQVTPAINRHDFGFIYVILDFNVLKCRPSKFRFQIGNKFFAFLEAGLPIVVNAENAYMARMVREHEIGIVLHSNEWQQAKERIEALDYAKAAANVRAFNRARNMRREIDRLIALYQEAGLDADLPDAAAA